MPGNRHRHVASVYAFRRAMVVRPMGDVLIGMRGDEAVEYSADFILTPHGWEANALLCLWHDPAPTRRHYCFSCRAVTTHWWCDNCGHYACTAHSPIESDFDEWSQTPVRFYVHTRCTS